MNKVFIDCDPGNAVEFPGDNPLSAGRWESLGENHCVAVWPMQDERGGYVAMIRKADSEFYMRFGTREMIAMGGCIHGFMAYGDPLPEDVPV
jgi:hypothetical protein